MASSTSFGSGLTTEHWDPESSKVRVPVLPSINLGRMSTPLKLSSRRAASYAETVSGVKIVEAKALVLNT